ncbi:acyl-CoA dehydrogenase family protein, partial [Streptomyces sp. NPDC054838]
MGIGITQEQRELADAVRGWIARAAPAEEARKLLDAPPQTGARPGYWDALAGSGLLFPHLEGGTLLDLAVVVEEAARAALPGAYLPSALASVLLERAGAEPLGGRVGAVALGPGTVTAVAAKGGGHLLDGLAPPVLGAGEAELVLLAAGTGHGTRWFAVDSAALEVRTHDSADPTRPTAEVRARTVTVPAGRLLELDPDLVRDTACALFAADACGTAARAVHTAAEYAKVREQFGRPIGQFQGVKHLCADMLVRLEQARALAWDAARVLDGPGGARSLVTALAAATALDAAYSCAKDCIQVLGGIGFTWEHDAHVQLRRAVVARQLLGPGDAHRLRAAGYAAAGARRELRLELPAEAEAYRTRARGVIGRARGLDPAAARRV